MRLVFIDTFYWIALANPQDDWHGRARNAYSLLTQSKLITTDEVLIEFLNYFSTAGSYTRAGISPRVQSILRNDQIEVISQTRKSFLAGLTLYSQRSDKGYSLTDCLSMCTMRQRQIIDVLTHDRHFTQEGFSILLTD